RQALERPVTLDFVAPSFHAVLEHVADKTQLPLSVDQLALQQLGLFMEEDNCRFQVKAKDEKVGAVLRRLLGTYRLTYVLLDDTLLITSDEGATQRLLRQQVDVDVTDVPLQRVARELGRRHGVNIVIDPRALKSAQVPVTLQLEAVGLETAVRLMA